MVLRRHFFLLICLFFIGCTPKTSTSGKITIGIVNFGQEERSLEKYMTLKNYLGAELKSIIEIEPAFNEIKAIEAIKRQNWDLVFAPAGLAAVAISEAEYKPILPLATGQQERSIIVVLAKSSISNLSNLGQKTLALGQPGSATGYYLPIYNLYGLTLKETIFTSNGKEILSLIADKKADAGALSLAEYNRYRANFAFTTFRILHTDQHFIPGGAILVSPKILPAQREKIRQALTNVSSSVAASAGYITNAPVPDYTYTIAVVRRVRPIAARIRQKPAPLYEEK